MASAPLTAICKESGGLGALASLQLSPCSALRVQRRELTGQGCLQRQPGVGIQKGHAFLPQWGKMSLKVLPERMVQVRSGGQES